MNRLLFLLALSLALNFVDAMAQNISTSEPTSPEAQVQLGKKYLDEKNYADAMKWFRKAAEKNDAVAQTNIGWLYQNGFGVKQDYAEAMAWHQKAAKQGNAMAAANIGWFYDAGLGVKQDYSEAMTWYLEAADKGNTQAQNNIGWLYEKGHGVTQDYAQAMAWFYRAAEQGNTQAQVNLAWLYQAGLGVPQDYAKAATFYRKAAEGGNANAQESLAKLYEHGQGVQQDNAEAMAWHHKAADQGNVDAKAYLDCLNERAKTADIAGPKDSETGCVIIPGGIRAPRAIFSPDPDYSREARKEKRQGTVVLSLVVDPEGKPRDIKVTQPLGTGLDQKAIDAVQTWKFEPAMKDGKPVAVQIMIEVRFRLY